MLATAAITNPIIRSRKGKKARRLRNNPINATRPDILPPTPEYIAQPEGPTKMQTGGYRVVDALERLFQRKFLDNSGGMNEAMYLSALWLRETFRRAGLDSSLGGGELDRIVSSGGNFSDKLDSHASAVDARREFTHAVKCLGWFDLFPFRGAGRIVVGLVCYGHTIRECAGLYLGGANARTEAVAMDRLREGLMTLAGVRGLTARRTSLRAAVQGFRDFAPGDVSW